jgi:catechol 2,3-dioxygenase-like lactoylglutathione lyase family enzyme
VKSLFPDICSDALTESKRFYSALFGFKPVFEIDWYVQLQSPEDESLQIAFVKRDHASVPRRFQQAPRGVVVTIETDEVDPVYARAKEMGLEFAQDLRDEVWGQRHFMTVDPNGLLVDVVQMIPPAPEFLKEHGLSA